MASGRGVCVGREPSAEQREPLRNRLPLGDSCGNGWRSPSNPVALTQTPELLSAAERDVVQTMQDDPPLPLEVGSSAHSGEEAVLTQLNLRLNSLSS